MVPAVNTLVRNARHDAWHGPAPSSRRPGGKPLADRHLFLLRRQLTRVKPRLLMHTSHHESASIAAAVHAALLHSPLAPSDQARRQARHSPWMVTTSLRRPPRSRCSHSQTPCTRGSGTAASVAQQKHLQVGRPVARRLDFGGRGPHLHKGRAEQGQDCSSRTPLRGSPKAQHHHAPSHPLLACQVPMLNLPFVIGMVTLQVRRGAGRRRRRWGQSGASRQHRQRSEAAQYAADKYRHSGLEPGRST